MENSVDMLAAYADGTARYVNHSGKLIVWDIADAAITGIIRRLLNPARAFVALWQLQLLTVLEIWFASRF
jgi:hypothetical protein